MRIHVTPGVDVKAAAADFLSEGIVAIDDIGGNLYDLDIEEILEELGHAADCFDMRQQRVDTPFGPVFVLRDASVWTAAKARKAVLGARPSV